MIRRIALAAAVCLGALPASGAQSVPAGIDAQFVAAARGGNAAELAFARLALARSGAPAVRGYAQTMIDDHTKLGAALGAATGSSAPAPLPVADALAYERLRRMAPAGFDQEYMMQMVGDHLATLGAFETEAQYGTNPALRSLAHDYVEPVQHHLEMAVDLTNHVGGSSPFKQH